MYRFLTTALAVLFGVAPAFADNYAATAGSGLTFAAKNVAGVLYPWWIPADSTGAAFGVSGNPFFVTNNGTFAVQATLQATATTAIGKVDPNTIGTWGLQVSTQNSATPTNGALALAQFNTAPTTITTGNVSPIQLDANGNLLVNVKAGGAGGGAVTVASGADVTEGTTSPTVTCATTWTVNGCLAQIDADVKGPLPAGTNNIGFVSPQSNTTGGATSFHLLTAASNNATQVKNSIGTLYQFDFENTGTGVYDIRFYDTNTAPSGGAPCNSATNLVGGNHIQQSNATSPGMHITFGPMGIAFLNGITVCVTGANADNDNTNATTGGNLNVVYK